MSEQPIKNSEIAPQHTEFKFVFCAHTAENVAAIGEALSDCDVIAVEAVGVPTYELQDNIGQTLTHYMSPGITEETKQDIEAWLCEDDDEMEFYADIAKRYLGSGKKMELVDMGAMDAAYGLVEHFDQTLNDSAENIIREQPGEIIADGIVAVAQSKAVMSAAREELVVEQLSALSRRYPGSKIGVVQGSIHTATQHAIHKTNPTSRVFIDGQAKPAAGIRSTYDYRDQLARQLRFMPEKPLDPNLIARAVLQDCLGDYYGVTVPRSMIDAMSDETVQETLDGIERTKNSGRSW